MDAKEVKTALKNAREAIRNKEFKEALRCCKGILAHDKTNYNALVFVGVAAEGLEQADQAVKAYKKATEVAPDQLLAWQGLSGFCEKNTSPENDAELINVYKKLIALQDGDKEKKQETRNKLAAMHGKLGNFNEAVEMYEVMLNESSEGSQRMQTLLSLFYVLFAQKSLGGEHQKLMLKTCQEALTMLDVSKEDSNRILQRYFQLKLKEESRDSVLKECPSLHEKFPANTNVMETWILLTVEGLLEEKKEKDLSTLRDLCEKLSKLSPNNPYASLAEGVVSFISNKLVEAREKLSQGCGDLPRLVSGCVFLAKCHQRLHAHLPCIQACDQGLKALERKDRTLTVPSKLVSDCLMSVKAECLYRIGSPSSLAQAREILLQTMDESKSRTLLVNVCIKEGNLEEAQKHLPSVSDGDGQRESLSGKILFYSGDKLKALDKFEAIADKHPTVSEHLYMLGRVLWEVRDQPEVDNVHDRCFKAFLKAAKLDPYNSEIFLYLGHFYSVVQKDEIKAKRCYQKSYDLDSGNEEAGAALCDILFTLNEHEEARLLLEKATNSAAAGSGKWAWLRLGLYQVKHGDPTVAVSSFQAALRADPRDYHVWECLAEAYLHRGSYTAALKTFTKAAELDPESVYSLFQIASIKQVLGEYAEAVAEYKFVLEKSSNYVPALKGLGETLLQQAREHLTAFLDDLARDRFQEALSFLTRAVSQRQDLSCLWKLMGDACTIIHPLASETFSMRVPSRLVQKDKSGEENSMSEESVLLGKMEVLQIGARCYGRALKGLPDTASLWHDLGVNFFHQSELSSSSAAEITLKAMQALKKAVSLDPQNFRHWNALGVIACAKSCCQPELAQHCFIKSVEAESNNTVAWTNLGTLYLQNHNVQLAHEAFKVAQSLDPNYVACWIGQALIAEIVGHDDAMDLFRHTTELGNHIEGAVGYGSWVCSILQDQSKRNTDLFQYCIKQMAAIPAASDALARYTRRVKTDATAYNMYGLLLEHQGLYNMSVKTFDSAINIIEKDSADEDLLVKLRINCGRVLCKGGNYKASVEMLEKAGSLEKVEDLCFLGLAYYKTERYQNSFQVYNQALGMAESDEDKSHTYAALGMVSYKFGDVEGTKTALFSGCQLSPPSAAGLKALCSLGLLQSDATLASATMQELFKLGGAHLPDVTWLSAALSILSGNLREAKRCIQQALVKNPSCPGLWNVLSSVLVSFFPRLGNAASQCGQASQRLKQSGHKNVPTMVTLGQLKGGLHSRRSPTANALSSAQKAIHLYPDRPSSHCSLISAIHAESVLQTVDKRRQLLKAEQSYIDHVLEDGASLKPELLLWCWKQKLVGLIHANEMEEAKEVLGKLSGLQLDPGNAQFRDSLQALTSKDIPTLQSLVAREGTQLYLWQVLIEVYIKQGMIVEADTAIRQALQLAQSDSPGQVQLESLLKLASVAFQQIMAGTGDKEMMRSIFDEAAEEVLKIDSGCSAVHLMMGALSLKSSKQSRNHYQKALEASLYRSNTHFDGSLSRRALIRNILKSKKDLPLAQKLIEDALLFGDEKTVKLYGELQGED